MLLDYLRFAYVVTVAFSVIAGIAWMSWSIGGGATLSLKKWFIAYLIILAFASIGWWLFR